MSAYERLLHTYRGPCRLSPVAELQPVSQDLGEIPDIHAQYFYSSLISIDDPLSGPVSASASSDACNAKLTLRPFLPGDNNALERAWLCLASDHQRQSHAESLWSLSPSPGPAPGLGPDPALASTDADTLAALVHDLAAKHAQKHGAPCMRPSRGCESATTGPPSQLGTANQPVCCAEMFVDAYVALKNNFCALTRRRLPILDHDRVLHAVMNTLNRKHVVSMPSSESQQLDLPDTCTIPTSARPGLSAKPLVANGKEPALTPSIPARLPPLADHGISGRPFVRVETEPTSRTRPPAEPDAAPCRPDAGRSRCGTAAPRSAIEWEEKASPHQRNDLVEVSVGLSRLHVVSLPVLQMKPIYWSPVNDMATVMRATWFHSETMSPLEPAVANQLEAGYRELKPWTETWADELRSAVTVGPLGETKVSHRLWPQTPWLDKTFKVKGNLAPEPLISTDPFCAARCFRGEAAAEGTTEPVLPHGETTVPTTPDTRAFAGHQVVYRDASAAFLLKPSLQPSAYYNRKPVAKIMSGRTVGIPVVRGFRRDAWLRLYDRASASRPGDDPVHTTQRSPDAGHAEQHHNLASSSTLSSDTDTQAACPGCEQEQSRSQVTDLCLVVHGIGQKFAERVESFHFTHAINAFRRAVALELRSPAVQPVLRRDQNGIMVLPINWRHTLRFEDGGSMEEDQDQAAYKATPFGLKDIEPNSIKSVRSLISDVMFDIPFYMSHHKSKMIAALVSEANRVYRLWCHNNPAFAIHGRVHLIGHSLGSAMAIEVLSRQPSTVPLYPLTGRPPELSHFAFSTTNLFLLGSPAAFFLLLERGGLCPRRGRIKPGADSSDAISDNVVGELGTFGCLAVDNLYNILAKEDPIAYLLNGTIDPVYAASLNVAYVPSATTSVLKSMGDAMRSVVGMASPAEVSVNALGRPATVRLPSQLELEVHDFSREEIAEKKAFLLNDNGQVDWFLRSGGGPLEIQYLNMLSAHTSYWTNPDLVRFLCIEMGREPGRAATLPSMRASKLRRPVLGVR